VEIGRMMRNPFARGLNAEHAEADIRKRRRALTLEEMSALLDSTASAPMRFGLTGEARTLL